MKKFFIPICVSGIVFSSLTLTFAANEIKVIPAKDANFEVPTTQSVEYTVNHESEENIVNLGEMLQAELAKAGTILRFITDPLPTGFIFDNIKNILNISKNEATAWVTQKIEYEICRDKPTWLNNLEFYIEEDDDEWDTGGDTSTNTADK